MYATKDVITRLAILSGDPSTRTFGRTPLKLGRLMDRIDSELGLLKKVNHRAYRDLSAGGPNVWTLAAFDERQAEYIAA